MTFFSFGLKPNYNIKPPRLRPFSDSTVATIPALTFLYFLFKVSIVRSPRAFPESNQNEPPPATSSAAISLTTATSASSLFLGRQLMSIGATQAPARPVSPVRAAPGSRLNPNLLPNRRSTATNITAAAASTAATKIHLSNLERLLLKQSPPPPPPSSALPPATRIDDPMADGGRGGGGPGSSLFHALNLTSLFPYPAEEMSPRSLTSLHRLLSESPRPSPKNSIASRWRLYHGAASWAGMLDPLDENLRRELLRYGDLVGAAYHAFHSYPGAQPGRPRHVVLPDRAYRVTASLFATSSLEIPSWASAATPPWMSQRSSWAGYVAVCDSEREISRMGRRDIVIALRGTATCLEWAENFRASLVPVDGGAEPHKETGAVAKVEQGFSSLFRTKGERVPSLAEAVVAEVKRLLELYKGEELSITITGHSLGAALGLLVADELSAALKSGGPGSAAAPPIAVFSFGGPKVGNKAFAGRLEERGVKVLRVVNANDVVTKVPALPLPLPLRGGNADAYAHVGEELRVESKASPYLRPDAGPACCHDLEAYLHLVDGFLGSGCPFRANAKRSIARLFDQQRASVKRLYVSKASEIGAGGFLPVTVDASPSPHYLPSPSSVCS